jgi:hypothetical protein
MLEDFRKGCGWRARCRRSRSLGIVHRKAWGLVGNFLILARRRSLKNDAEASAGHQNERANLERHVPFSF